MANKGGLLLNMGQIATKMNIWDNKAVTYKYWWQFNRGDLSRRLEVLQILCQ